MPIVDIYNRQDKLKISKKRLREIVLLFCKLEAIATNQVIVHLVDNREIMELHLKYFNDGDPTDCISFPIDSPYEDNCICLGEIFISTDVACEYANHNGIDPQKEVALYLIHGLLHLIGYKDDTAEERKAMTQKQNQLLATITETNFL